MNKDKHSGLLPGSELGSGRGLGKRQNSKIFCFGGQTFRSLLVVIQLFLSDPRKAEDFAQVVATALTQPPCIQMKLCAN